MTSQAQAFPYVVIDPTLGPAGTMPYLSLVLERQGQAVSVQGLVDSGSALNVLPYDQGLRLGAVWDRQTVNVPLAGNLAATEAKALLLKGSVGSFAPVNLAFAWAKSNDMPVILGQVNFFMEFEVCFFRPKSIFEIKPKLPTRKP